MADHQTERAFQKQPTINLNRKLGKNKKPTQRYWRNIGLGIKTPEEAINGHYIDKKCPFTGNVPIHGRVIKGVVRSTKMKRTIIVRRDYLNYIRKYNRYEKRHRNISAHCSPAFRVAEGDMVTIGQCRCAARGARRVAAAGGELTHTHTRARAQAAVEDGAVQRDRARAQGRAKAGQGLQEVLSACIQPRG
jgi:small subunit ribosomal protein S11e